jgi:hypothetical protein
LEARLLAALQQLPCQDLVLFVISLTARFLAPVLLVPAISMRTTPTCPDMSASAQAGSLVERLFVRSLEREHEELQRLCPAVGMLALFSALCHDLQCERGGSSAAVCPFPPFDGAALADLRSRVDASAGGLLDRVEEILAGGIALGARETSQLGCALERLNALPEWRDKVDRGTADPLAVFTYFSDLIDRLLSVGFGALDGLPVAGLAAPMAAGFHLAEAKEAAGRERALIARIYSGEAVTATMRDELAELIERQEAALAHCAALAPDAQGCLSQTSQALERHRRLAVSPTGPQPDAAQAREWFALASARIDAFRKAECAFTERLSSALEESVETARARLEESRGASPPVWPSQPAAPRFLIVSGGIPGNPAKSEGMASSAFLARPLSELLAEHCRRLDSAILELAAAREALDERKLVDRAKGLLMQHKNLGEEAAYRLLREEAMRRSVRISEVAASLIRSAPLWKQ